MIVFLMLSCVNVFWWFELLECCVGVCFGVMV